MCGTKPVQVQDVTALVDLSAILEAETVAFLRQQLQSAYDGANDV